MLSVVSLMFSGTALVVSLLAYRQARNTALLGSRREAIDHLRSALSDVALHAHIDGKTVSSIREAYQISSLVFSKRLIESLDKLYGIAFRLQHKSLDRQTEQDWKDKDLLTEELQQTIDAMKREAALNTWL
jgi:hypothetical protein